MNCILWTKGLVTSKFCDTSWLFEFFSNKDEKLKIYRVHNGEITDTLKSYQNKGENNDNKKNINKGLNTK